MGDIIVVSVIALRCIYISPARRPFYVGRGVITISPHNAAIFLEISMLCGYNIFTEQTPERSVSMSFPQYMRIALDIANRIAAGEIAEQQRISGRSLLSSQYHVSPETVRKALSLLNDMNVVQVKEKSGVIILSAEAARRFLSNFEGQREQQELRAQLQELTEQGQTVARRIAEVSARLLEAQTTPLPTEKRLPNYELQVPAGSPRVGQSVGSLHFWQATGATVIAIRRNQNTILSPGPYAELQEGDMVVFVGAPESVSAVERFLAPDGETTP